jgi:hypothetical protein
MGCRIVKTVCKTAAETKLWGFDYAGFDADAGSWNFLARVWAPGTGYAASTTVRPTKPTGWQYVSSGGHSGKTEPRWPTAAAGTVTDGSITWTAEAVSNDSLWATVDSSAWDVGPNSPAGITVGGEALVNTDGSQIATAQVSGGTVDELYEVTNTVTLSDGSIEESMLLVKIS